MKKHFLLTFIISISFPICGHTGIDIESALSQLDRERVQMVNFIFSDLHGSIREVTIPRIHVKRALEDGLYFDSSSIPGFGTISESDKLLKPDLNTLRIIPWLTDTEKTALIICDIYKNEEEPYEGDPRYRLRRQIEMLNQEGLQFFVGPELEFFLLKAENTPCDTNCYWEVETDHQKLIAKNKLVNFLLDFGINVEKLHHEVASGQHEISLRYGNALEIADQILLAKYAITTIAHGYGLHATFMPKPFATQNGSGMHIHFSVWNQHANLFANPETKKNMDPLSDYGKEFIAGVLTHSRELCALFNPSINSFKRLVPGFEAPIHICWGTKNRSALIRLPQTKSGELNAVRAELRCPDALCNPYLAFGALLAAGITGHANRYQLDPSVDGSAYTLNERTKMNLILQLPSSLEDALAQLEMSELARSYLGDHLFEQFLEAKKGELSAYYQQITPWEWQHYGI